MTYKNLKKFLSQNDFINNDFPFDLMPHGIKSKIILSVGDSTGNALSFLSSVMRCCDIPHQRYSCAPCLDLKNRFVFSTKTDIDTLCDTADKILKKCKKMISNEDLLLILALYLLDNNDYLLLDVTKEQYTKAITYLSPFAIMLAIDNDKEIKEMVSLSPSQTKYIVAQSQVDDFSFIPSQKAPNGASICYASRNKITIKSASIFGTDIFHYDYPYHIPTIDQRSISLAHLAIEASGLVFSVAKSQIAKGLKNASDIYDLTLYSIFPSVFLRLGDADFVLHHNMKYKIITKDDDIIKPTESTIFCGDEEFLTKVKKIIK